MAFPFLQKLQYQGVLSFILLVIIVLQLIQPFTTEILIFTHQQQTALENIVGKGEIARNEQFLLFPQ